MGILMGIQNYAQLPDPGRLGIHLNLQPDTIERELDCSRGDIND
jgi:hypothetical protein